MLRLEGISSQDVGFYVGAREGDDGKTRAVPKAAQEAASRKPVVLASYGLANQGTNCPWWDACILATPRGDARQPIGRVLREHPGKKQPAVIDLVDVDSDVFLGWASARNRYYRSLECGAEVHDMQVPEEFA
jgi:superfamily II DNA or RNA helicase